MADDWQPVGADDWQPVVNLSAQSPAAQPMQLAKQGGLGLVGGTEGAVSFFPTLLKEIGHGVSRLTGLPEPEPIAGQPQLSGLITGQPSPLPMTPGEQIAQWSPPQNQTEAVTRAAASGVPGAAFAGGRILPNIIGGAASGAGGYVGGQLAPNFGFDPTTGAVVGALTGAAVGLRTGENAANTVSRRAVAPSEQILDAGTNIYNQVREEAHAIPIPPGGLHAFTEQLTNYLRRVGPSPENAQSAYNEIAGLTNPTFQGRPDLADLIRVRQNLHEILRTRTDAQNQSRAVAAMAIPEIDGAIRAINPDMLERLQTADRNWSAGVTMEALQGKVAKAEGGAEAANSGLNSGNKIRQSIDQLLNGHTDSRGRVHGLNPQDVATLRAARAGDVFTEGGRYISNLLGGGGGLGAYVTGIGEAALGAGGALATNQAGWTDQADPLMGAIAFPTLGLLGRLNYNRSVGRAARNAEATIGARSPYAQAAGQHGPAPLLNVPRSAVRSAIFARPELLGLIPGSPQQ